MKSVRRAHIVVVADSDHALVFVACLRRMQLAEVTTVAGLEEARHLCRAGGVNACIVVVDDAVPDAPPILQGDAPGRGCGVPTLMVVAVVSPGLRKLARRAGYAGAIPAAIAPRLLYRRIRAALQRRRAAANPRRRRSAAIFATPFALESAAMAGKPTLH
jgi:DNA-binding response OmpR family regulator